MEVKLNIPDAAELRSRLDEMQVVLQIEEVERLINQAISVNGNSVSLPSPNISPLIVKALKDKGYTVGGI